MPIKAETSSCRFLNYGLDVNHIDVFLEDSSHQIWAGTFQNGIGIFDDNSFVQRAKKLKNYGIHCLFQLNDLEILVGTRYGLYNFNTKTHSLITIECLSKKHIRGIYRNSNNHILVFCSDCIVTLDDKGNTQLSSIPLTGKDITFITPFPNEKDKYIVLTDKINIYHNSNIDLSPISGINLPQPHEIPFCATFHNKILWIGTDKGLYTYDFSSESLLPIEIFNGYVIRTILSLSDGGLWIGTEDGLFYHENSKTIRYIHSPDNSNSLLNNSVWSLFQDSQKNIWIGLDYGLSIIPHDSGIKIYQWNDLISTEEGNRVTIVKSDSRGRYWIGGMNGLGMYNHKTKKSNFFKHLSSHSLPNNYIRAINEDAEGKIWICSDGGVAYFDESDSTFKAIEVTDSTEIWPSVWAYGITHSPDSTLWLASCSGGIMGFKSRDIKNGKIKAPVTYNEAYSKEYRIPTEYMQIERDKDGNIWANARNSLAKIDYLSGKISFIKSRNTINLKGNNGILYFHDANTLFSINNNQIDTINLSHVTASFGAIRDIAPTPSGIWFLTPGILGKFDPVTKVVRYLAEFDKELYQSCNYLENDSSVWLGGVDYMMVIKDDYNQDRAFTISPQSLIQDILVNGESITPDNFEFMKYDIAFSDYIELPPVKTI